MNTRTLFPSIIANQRRAAEPRSSAWVSANAGSGKTTVLARRVVRLLLAGARPSKLLCLTFTRAAAANMQNRVFRDLSTWAIMPDDQLSAAIADLEGYQPDADALRRARRLFAEAIETPGGLKIMTIHGFCERILRQFPFEANVPAGFEILETRKGRQLLDEARAAVIQAGLKDPTSQIGLALARVIDDASEESFNDLMDEIAANREVIATLLKNYGGPDRAATRLAELLSLTADETTSTIEDEILEFGLPQSNWRMIAQALRETSSTNDRFRAEKLEAACIAADLDEKRVAYLGFFTTENGEILKSIATKAFVKLHPALFLQIEDEKKRLDHLIQRRKATRTVERTKALLVIANAMIKQYENTKAKKAALDFDDLIVSTRVLIERAGAEWVLYKLDQGIDHILLDEAQDTSPDQWKIIEKLVEDFFAGDGTKNGSPRTVFAVGDEKQSIFSFQGAEPQAFAQMRQRFMSRVEAAGLDFSPVSLAYSFRSTLDVLSAVDAVFADPGNRRGLSFDDIKPEHQTVRTGETGRVEVWPLVLPRENQPTTPWDAAFDEVNDGEPMQRLAGKIANEVSRWTTSGCPDTGEIIQPGDVMILVRTRNSLFHAIIRALKRARVPVAGADRLVLTEHIAVMDLMALARFALRPEDDLTLATVLKSPLIGFTDENLLSLVPFGPESLWAAIQARSDPVFVATVQTLKLWRDEGTVLTPFSYFTRILSRDGGRSRFLARLGNEASDALDEFVAAAQDYEATHSPSLQGFIAWLEEAATVVKRDMDVARGEVRVMTTHGAKGLEAKVVILADTCTAPSGKHDPALFFISNPRSGHNSPPLLLWATNKAQDTPLASRQRQALQAEAQAEHRRLLYVAMTRAEDRLIVAGYEGARKRPADNWYDMIEYALRSGGACAKPMPDGDGERLVWSKSSSKLQKLQTLADPAEVRKLPPWLRCEAARETVDRISVSPSLVSTTASLNALSMNAGDKWAQRRGNLIHRLLQALPEAGENRVDAGRILLGQAAPDKPEEHEALLRTVLSVLENEAFSKLFIHGSRPEVPIVGQIARPGQPSLFISGRIDRISVLDDAVLIADFKTNNTVPKSTDEIPETYLTQLALYRAALAHLYPQRKIEAMIVWTTGPVLMPISDATLDTMLRLTLAA